MAEQDPSAEDCELQIRGMAHLLDKFEEGPPPPRPDPECPNTRRFRRLHNIFDPSRAKWDPFHNPQAEGDPRKTVFVGRLNYETSEDTLRQVMSKFGSFDHTADAERAFRDGNSLLLDGHKILVDHERARIDPLWRPRRLRLPPPSRHPTHCQPPHQWRARRHRSPPPVTCLGRALSSASLSASSAHDSAAGPPATADDARRMGSEHSGEQGHERAPPCEDNARRAGRGQDDRDLRTPSSPRKHHHHHYHHLHHRHSHGGGGTERTSAQGSPLEPPQAASPQERADLPARKHPREHSEDGEI